MSNTACKDKDNSGLDLSFEFFPPRSAKMENKFWRTVGRLEALRPSFFSVTYGALGSGQNQSLKTIKMLCAKTKIPVAAHLTCVDASRTELNKIIDDFESYGVSGIVALRGDGEDPQAPFIAHPDGYKSVPELVDHLHAEKNFNLSVAAYPETHPQATSDQSDLEHLKRKLDAGADRAITQYFYDAEVFLRFRDRATSAGIDKPIVAGILPIHSYDRVVKFSKACGASVPVKFAAQYERVKDDPQAIYDLSVEQTAVMCTRLISEGVDQFHFYTLNLADLSYAVCCELLLVKPDNGDCKNAAA